MSYDNLPKIDNKRTFNNKSDAIKLLIRQSLQIISCLGVPIDDLSERQKEKMAMALLAVGCVKNSNGWKRIKDSNNDYALKTRDIITFYNENLEENVSSGSYDDVRRSDLERLLQATIVVRSKPTANNSNPTRGYKVNAEYSRIIRNYGQSDWFAQVDTFSKSHPSYEDRISQKRNIPKLKVTMPDGKEIELKDGEHNSIQKQIIEEFLPRYGKNAVVLYCGDADNKYGIIFEKEQLTALGFGDLKQGKLPDVVAYSPMVDWIFMIEAYHTSNPITRERKYELEQLLGDSAKKAVFVTAFENAAAYRNCSEELAWETEIWIATEPDHMIHRNGHRFMGPYSDKVKRGSLVCYEKLGFGTVVKVGADFIEVTFPEQFKTLRFPYPSYIDNGEIKVIEV